jgi:hypothetical protein
MSEEEMGRDSAAMVRALMQAALVVGEHLSRLSAEQRHRAAAAVGQNRAVLQARIDGEQRAAEAFLAVAATDSWWESASRDAIAEAWCTAVAWREHSRKAAEAEAKLRSKIKDRYGVDPADPSLSGMATTVPITEQMLAQAAWRRHRVRDNDAALDAVDLATIREGLDREALYSFVVLHEQATAELNRLSSMNEDGAPVDAETTKRLGEQHQALAAAENAMRGLGPVGQDWLRHFDDDRDMAYASVLVSPDPTERAKMWDIAGRLASVRAEWVEAGHIGGDNETVAALHEEMPAVGESGQRWLASHRTALTAGTAERDRSLTWLRGNPAVEKEALARLEASLTLAALGTNIASDQADLVDQAKHAYQWFLDNDHRQLDRFNRDMKKAAGDLEKLAGVYRSWIDEWQNAQQQQVAGTTSTDGISRATTARTGSRSRSQRSAKSARNLDPAQMEFTDTEVRHARAWFQIEDPEQLRKWDWKIGNMRDTEYGTRSVHAEMVHRWRRGAYDTPERRAALADQLDNAGVGAQAKTARLAADICNAHPASEAARATATPPAPTAPMPDFGAARDFELGG